MSGMGLHGGPEKSANAYLESSNRDVYYLDILLRLLLIHFCIFNPMYHVQALKSATKDRVLLIQPRHLLRRCGDEELGS